MTRFTNYCCCTQTVQCRYCIRANLEPFIQPKEQINELENMNTKLITQNHFIDAIKAGGNYIIGSVDNFGHISFATNPANHPSAAHARAECKRLAKLTPGKLYLFVKLDGAEMVPANTLSI